MEELIIKYCSPVLAGIKTGSLFNCVSKKEDILNNIKKLNDVLSVKGIYIIVLKSKENFFLIYVCRKTDLLKDLSAPETRNFLRIIGYKYYTFEALIDTLKRRLSQENAFPHEIGLFLSYPLEDVKGFIKNKGRSFKICGCRKVYSDVANALEQFTEYKKCTEIYTRLYKENKYSIEELTAAD